MAMLKLAQELEPDHANDKTTCVHIDTGLKFAGMSYGINYKSEYLKVH